MSYFESEGREVLSDNDRNIQFYRMRGQYSLQLQSLLRSPCGASLVTAEKMFAAFLKQGQIPHPTHLLDRNGNVEPEFAFGFGMLASKELVLNRFVTIGRVLEADIGEMVDLPITDDLPQFTTMVRNMFPPEVDDEVMGICQSGIMSGWGTMLDILGRRDVPLAMFPKTLDYHLTKRSKELYPWEDGIVLPTALTGVRAKYDYSNEFLLPYVTLAIEPSRSA